MFNGFLMVESRCGSMENRIEKSFNKYIYIYSNIVVDIVSF